MRTTEFKIVDDYHKYIFYFEESADDKTHGTFTQEYTFEQIKDKVCTGHENFTIYLKQTKTTVKSESNGGTKVTDQTVESSLLQEMLQI